MTAKSKVLLPAGFLAAALVAAACVPPSTDPPGGSTTTTTSAGRLTTTSSTSTTSTTVPPLPTTIPDKSTRLYSPSPLSTSWGIEHPGPGFFDGVIYSVEIVADTVYVGGTFSKALRYTQTVPRSNLMAVQRSTGIPLAFNPEVNGTVRAVASDGVSLYIGGDFTAVDGVPATRLAKLDLTTGAVDTAFNASASNVVRDLVVAGSRLYVVGEFNNLGGSVRHFAGAVDTATGAVDPTFDPSADAQVNTVAVNPAGTKVYLGGNFLTVGGTARSYVTELDPVTGKVQGPSFKDAGDLLLDLNVKPDGTMLYAAGGGGFNSAVGWDAKTGARKWTQRANGDTQAVVYSNGYVYMGFHDGFDVAGVPNLDLRLLALDPMTGEVDPTFQPISGSYPAVLTLDSDGTYLVAGGWFPRMGGYPSANGLSIHP